MNHGARTVVLGVALIGCVGPERSAVVQPLPAVTAAPRPVETMPAPAEAPAGSPPGAHEEHLPAPKPTTIALSRTGDPALDANLAEADKAFEASDLEAALAGYEAARKVAPKRAAPIVGVARTKIMKATPSLGFAAATNQPDVISASKELKRAVEIEAGFGPALVEYGRSLLLLGDAAGAEMALRRGVRAVGEEAEAHSALGVALLANGKGDEALAALTRARELDPGSAARRGNLGTVLFMRGKVADAIKEYEVQVRLAPDDPRAHSDLGTALLAGSDFARAVPELKKAIELDPKRATFHSNLGYALQLEGKSSEAIAEYREALRLDAKLVSAWVNLATALSRDPKTRAEARRALRTAAGLDPTDPRVKANIEELDALERQGPSGSPTTSTLSVPRAP